MPAASSARGPGKPILLVDVDGVISLFGFDSQSPPEGTWLNVEGLLHLCSARAAEHLPALSDDFELVWCTGWEEKAGEHLAPLIGLDPSPPYLSFDRNPGRGHAHWKLAAIDAHAGPERPLAWIDDAFNDACHDWARLRPGPTRVVTTAPAAGRGDSPARALRAWEST
ncbi:MAG: hypothetical protein ACKOK7_06675, partial [Solirubrobacterales bacterium]